MENTMDEKTQDEVVEELKAAPDETTDDTAEENGGEEKTMASDAVEENNSSENNDFKEKYYYLAAEMQNMQRRFEREKDDLHKFGSEKIMKDLVAVVDNFERSLSFIKDEEDEKIKTIAEGIQMVSKLFLDTLEKHGLRKIEALGKEFDPNFHEALAQQPAEGKKDMEVIQVFENGYTLNDRVIRAAKVIVAKN